MSLHRVSGFATTKAPKTGRGNPGGGGGPPGAPLTQQDVQSSLVLLSAHI